MKLFVPGRICLFGEHTDWAGGYRRLNAELEKGYTIISGTNQGIHAEVEPHPTKLIIRSSVDGNGERKSLEIPMDRELLLAEAQKGGFFSYAAGVAFQVSTHYRVRGLVIDNTLTDLPIKKGLSSSAAICVLVARAFNRIYDLKMTVRGEMEFAYLGEITTPSRCGRMDQGCAYGNRPILMVFDGDRLEVSEFKVGRDMNLVIVDLCAGKDTREILKRLNNCYPFADDDIQRGVQHYLGPVSADITAKAGKALEEGDAKRLGELMTLAQKEFDRYAAPACPGQLTAPVLHKVLNDPGIQDLIYGGKGVGSQGDGSAQLVARDGESQRKLAEVLRKDFGMPSLDLVLKSDAGVRKAVIPAAGFGTRLFPATKAVKKELFPIVDAGGVIKPVILVILEEALSSGIEQVCVVVQAQDRELFEEIFGTPPAIENYNKLSSEGKNWSKRLLEIGSKVTFVAQDLQDGFGHAVHCAGEWVGDEPFLLLLGDHLYLSPNEISCARQMLDIYERTGTNVVGLKETHVSQVSSFGCVGGTWKEKGRILTVTEFSEKPDAEYAREHLAVEGMEEDMFLSVFGLYVLSPAIFEYLSENIRHNVREKGEFQLTSCLDRLRQEEGFAGYVVEGSRFDIGQPESYRKTLIDYPRVQARKEGGGT
ncbi:MAG: sugar phosphate nucleotidyltransferase [Kiritimatiellia bacterium]